MILIIMVLTDSIFIYNKSCHVTLRVGPAGRKTYLDEDILNVYFSPDLNGTIIWWCAPLAQPRETYCEFQWSSEVWYYIPRGHSNTIATNLQLFLPKKVSRTLFKHVNDVQFTIYDMPGWNVMHDAMLSHNENYEGKLTPGPGYTHRMCVIGLTQGRNCSSVFCLHFVSVYIQLTEVVPPNYTNLWRLSLNTNRDDHLCTARRASVMSVNLQWLYYVLCWCGGAIIYIWVFEWYNFCQTEGCKHTKM
jgi:hypothetical protein